MRVLIYGCGPAGLIAAHAMHRRGHTVRIVSDTMAKSEMNGAQYLHKPIPGVTQKEDALDIWYLKPGNKRNYAINVYGDGDAPVSWTKFTQGKVVGYSLQNVYNRLWDRYLESFRHGYVSNGESNVWEEAAEADMVISTIPRTAWCRQPDKHEFVSQEIMIAMASELDHTVPPNVVMYNGTADRGWYRTSRINGIQSTEIALLPKKPCKSFPADVEQRIGYKPLRHYCTCEPPNAEKFHYLGRFGQWQKHVLLHNVWEDAQELAQSLVWQQEEYVDAM